VVHWREEGGQSKRQVCISVLYHNEADGDKVLDQLDSGNGNGNHSAEQSRPMGRFETKVYSKKPRDYYHAESVNGTARETDGDSIDLQLSDRTAKQ